MAQEKTRIKFRVSAADGVASSGLPAPRWSEKWGVSLFDYEEFHVTDHLLKLPFQENPPKTVCVFSVATGALQFRLLDGDRLAEVNGVAKREAVVSIGDRIRIGEHLTIEVVLAPKPMVASERQTSISLEGLAGSAPEEGPTLTLTAAVPVKSGMIFAEKSSSILIDEPSFKQPGLSQNLVPTTAREPTAHPAVDRGPTLGIDGSSPHIATSEPTLETVRPGNASVKAYTQAPAVSRAPTSFLKPEPKIELVNLPHAVRDDSLESRVAGFAQTGDSDEPDPLYARDAKLDARPSFSEKILAAFSRVLRRDELSPPEALPSDAIGGIAPPKPWIPAENRDPGISAMRPATYGASSASARAAQPWIPQAEPSGARMRGRALVFLVAAGGALMIAVGVMRIQENLAREQSEREAYAPVSFSELSRGIPVEMIEDKVRRMRRSR